MIGANPKLDALMSGIIKNKMNTKDLNMQAPLGPVGTIRIRLDAYRYAQTCLADFGKFREFQDFGSNCRRF